MVIIIIKMNEMTIKDANLSSNLNEFVENFAEMSISSLMNYFLEYNNFSCHAKFRDMMAIIILLSFLRQTTLL